jgi:hypothetical protein
MKLNSDFYFFEILKNKKNFFLVLSLVLKETLPPLFDARNRISSRDAWKP